MAKAKPAQTRAKGQTSIHSFFGGGKPKKDLSNEPAENQDKNDEEDSDDDVEIPDAPQAVKKGNKASAPDASDLPPINDIPSMFSDLVSRIEEIKGVAEHVAGRKLRVATMCSGTESPLLALELIQQAIFDHYGIQLDIEHVFSCEIEPFKQAYIERNFHPPILFRDVCELGDDEAHTVYGALAPVPGDVDILIAGTSCVDYSNLNTQKQDIDANGESGRTFRGMMTWVTRHRPPLVILENVCSAPWDRVQEYFEKNNYSAAHQRVDTKHYYIPHTRTRGYLVAVNKKNSSIPSTWSDLVKNRLKRPASSTLDAFLLPTDDPRIHQARQKLVQESYNALDRRTGRTDWGRCESRHQRARLEEQLGAKRPLTSWDEGGFCKLPDFAWGDWGVGQVERVWDLMDISLLRSATKGVDPSFKTTVWNLSQNVDRTIGSNKVGICPCLTPSMIPYITNRGGPMVGIEALSMQGLPVDKLLLTRETEDQLADLAGNAMSTTVVGSCILAALVAGKKLLKAGDDTQTYETKAGTDDAEDTSMDVDPISNAYSPSVIVGEDQLVQEPLNLSSTTRIAMSHLLAHADNSARLCSCEGRLDMTKRPLFRCQDCGASSCKKCGGRPEHNLSAIDVSTRLLPSTFANELKSSLPMCITLPDVTSELLDGLRTKAQATIPEKRWASWSAAVIRASQSEIRFVETKRQEIWIAVYQSPFATLELLLHPQQPEWRLYATPDESEPTNADIRRVLESPVGRLTISDNLLTGRWEFALPCVTPVNVTIEGIGDLMDSWEARLGLLGELGSKKVFSALRITVPTDKIDIFDRDISGVYNLFEKCGTANGALHKKEATSSEVDLPPIFFFMDPHRTDDSEDCFVFSTSKRRYEYGESRPIISKVDTAWRQTSEDGPQDVLCRIPVKWVLSEAVKLHASTATSATVALPQGSINPPVSNDACCNANALLVCTVHLRGQAGPEWPRGEWKEVSKIQERSIFKSLSWLLERVSHIDDKFLQWQEVVTPTELSNCERCAPTAPALEWIQAGKKVVAVEDPIQAGEYERRLKSRPSPFLTQLKLEENNAGTVRIGINVPSLIHRALSRLPSTSRSEPPTLSWRIDTNFTPLATIDHKPFTILSNKLDKEHDQPPSFELDLRKEQLRSLGWMLRQESRDAEPFIEEEVSEAILSPLGWRAEGRAQRPVYIRGGVLADQVGYGKTAITLGLIDCASADVKEEFKRKGDIAGKIPVKASLIVVPPHLTRQWKNEIEKFTGNRFKTEVLASVSNLNSITITQIQKADIVIVASNLFKSNAYLENLQTLAAAGELPSREGRHFNARLETILSSLRSQTELLKTKGSAAVADQIKFAEETAKKAAAAAAASVQSKRLKGKSYRDAVQKAHAKNGDPATESKKPDMKKGKVITRKTQDSSITGKTVEVYIATSPKRTNGKKSSASSVASSPPVTEVDSEAPLSAAESSHSIPTQTAKRRATIRKSLVVSSESEDEGQGRQKKANIGSKKRSAKRGPTLKKAKTDMSDYEASSSEESQFDSDEDPSRDDSESSDDERASKKRRTSNGKSKTTAVPRPKAKGKAITTSSSSDVDMDVDTDASTKKPPKRKAADDDERPAKKKRVDSDPWKLTTPAVQKDWTSMKAPPLEMFHWGRIVVDEYTYLDGKVHTLVTKVTADRRWVLSGTPPIHDFGAVKTIAAFLNIHLGVDDDAEGQSAELKRRRREQTAVEQFHSFREVHTLEWHGNRVRLAQGFLDQYLRQNIAEIDEIPWTEKILRITLGAAERAIYLELDHHLQALDMNVKRGKKTDSDRERRLNQSLGDSKSAEEALLKRCSHFDLEMTNDNAMKACDVIVLGRQKQLDECKADLLKATKEGMKREQSIGATDKESMFIEWIRVSRGEEGIEDIEASQVVVGLLDEAGADETWVAKSKKLRDVKWTESLKERVWEHREKTHEIRRISKEHLGRVRSLRYFTVVRDLQKQREEPPIVNCPNCDRQSIPMGDVAILSSCGHMGCWNCVKSRAESEECVYAGKGGCKAAGRVLNVIKAETLGVDDPARHGQGKHFGEKLERIVDLIKNVVKKDERVLVFVQFPDLMKKVTEAFTHNKIQFLEIKGTAHQKSKNLEAFQNNSKERVLLLNVMDESASGANLTSANHAIFVSPLLAPTKEIYKACETQAIGRLVRFGQTKHVYVWRCLTTDTIDEEIYEKRKRELSEQPL